MEIAKRTKELPFGVEADYYSVVAVISDEMMTRMGGTLDGFYAEAEDTKILQEEIQGLDESIEWYFIDYEQRAKEQNSRTVWYWLRRFSYMDLSQLFRLLELPISSIQSQRI